MKKLWTLLLMSLVLYPGWVKAGSFSFSPLEDVREDRYKNHFRKPDVVISDAFVMLLSLQEKLLQMFSGFYTVS